MFFEKNEFIDTLYEVFKRNELDKLLTEEAASRFAELCEILLCENEKYNLTAIKEPKKIILNHFADCAALAEILDPNIKIADIGCGAGFPSLPIAILRPDVNIIGIDSTQKRINYVNMAKDALGLTNIEAICKRAEEAGNSDMRESFDVATARAVAAMPILTELCLPLVKVGGKMIAMKGKNAGNELSDAKRAITLLGGKIKATHEVRLSDDEEEIIHPLIIIDKKSQTPKQYPRAFSQISKKPL